MNRALGPANLHIDTKNIRRTPDHYSFTPELPKPFQKTQGKEFLQLYWKARSFEGDSPLKIKNQPKSATIKKRKDDNESIGITNSNDSDKENNPFERNIVLNNLKPGLPGKPFSSGKPSRFKLQHDNVVNIKDSTEVKESIFKPKGQLGVNYFQDNKNFDIIEIHQEEQKQEEIQPQNLNEEQNYVPESYTIEILDENRDEEHKHNHSEHEVSHDHDHDHEHANINNLAPPPLLERPTSGTFQGRINDPHADRTYMKFMKSYIFSFVIYAALLGLDFGLYSFHLVLSFLWVFEAYTIYEIWKEASLEYSNTLRRKRRITSILELISLGIFQIAGMMKLEGIDFSLSLGLIPLTITGISTCYLTECGSQQNSNLLSSTLKTLLWVQLLHISLKSDNLLSWTWPGIFWITWTFLVIVLFYCVGLFMMFLFFLCFETSNTVRNYQLTGLVWVLLALGGYSGTMFCVCIGFVNKLQYGDKDNLLRGGLIAGIVHSFFLTVFTFFTRNSIKRFLRHMARVEARATESKAPEFKFEKDPKDLPPYIVMFSPSYFSTFNESLKIKNREKLRDMKKRVSQTKMSQYRKLSSQGFLKPLTIAPKTSVDPLGLAAKKLTSDASTSKDKISINITNPDKRDILPPINNIVVTDLSRQAVTSQISSPQVVETANRLQKQRPTTIIAREPMMGRKNPLKSHINSPIEDCFSAVQIKKEEDLNYADLEQRREKLCFSDNDVEFVKQMGYTDFLSDQKFEVNTPVKKTSRANLSDSKEDKTCIICFDKFPDAVIMKCGHGGICYECALETWKKTQECFMCRAKIEKILHIAPQKMGKFNLRKVLSCTKLTKLESQSPLSDSQSFTDNLNIAQGII